jgi:iron complex transport system substrate-binding protein
MKRSWLLCVVTMILGLAILGSSCTSPGPEPRGEVVTVVDSLGNEVMIPKQVSGVASMRSGITEIICALGQKDKIVAVEEGTKEGAGYGAFIAGVHPDLMERDCPLAGGDISAEEMLRIDPDLVLHGGYGRIKQADAFKEQVPEMPVVIAHFETLEHYMDDIRIVAQCVNAEERAEELITYLQSKLDFVASAVGDVPEGEKVRVFYGGHDIYHAYGGETFEHFQIVRAGGVNVAADLTGWMPEVSAEQLLQWDPQVVVLLSGVSVDDVLNDSKLASLSAVQDGRVYALPESGWDFSSPRALFCIEWLASKLYPERFADVDIEAEADEFYQNVFGVDYAGPSLAEAGGTHVVTDMAGRQVLLGSTR